MESFEMVLAELILFKTGNNGRWDDFYRRAVCIEEFYVRHESLY